jgi:hypothetical protein
MAMTSTLMADFELDKCCCRKPALGRASANTPHAAVLQLQGKNLVPFTFDKQTMFLQTARNLFQ